MLNTHTEEMRPKIVKTDVSIAKNYLKEVVLADMGQLVNGILELAERTAKRHIPMTMEDWAERGL